MIVQDDRWSLPAKAAYEWHGETVISKQITVRQRNSCRNSYG